MFSYLPLGVHLFQAPVMLIVAHNKQLQYEILFPFSFVKTGWFCARNMTESQMCFEILFQAVEGT